MFRILLGMAIIVLVGFGGMSVEGADWAPWLGFSVGPFFVAAGIKDLRRS